MALLDVPTFWPSAIPKVRPKAASISTVESASLPPPRGPLLVLVDTDNRLLGSPVQPRYVQVSLLSAMGPFESRAKPRYWSSTITSWAGLNALACY